MNNKLIKLFWIITLFFLISLLIKYTLIVDNSLFKLPLLTIIVEIIIYIFLIGFLWKKKVNILCKINMRYLLVMVVPALLIIISSYGLIDKSINIEFFNRIILILLFVINEEIVFRGFGSYLFLDNNKISNKSIILVSIVFGLCHLINPFTSLFNSVVRVVYSFVFGMFLHLIYRKVDNIFIPIIFHFINNVCGDYEIWNMLSTNCFTLGNSIYYLILFIVACYYLLISIYLFKKNNY